jgi:hypothetical protein
MQIMVRYDPEAALTDRFRNYSGWLNWRPNLIWAIIVGIILIYGLTNISRVKEFIYVQF